MKLKSINKRKRREELLAWLFVTPFTIGFIIFILSPILYGVAISFFDYNSLRSVFNGPFVGFDNYIDIFKDKIAIGSYIRSLQYSLIYVSILLILGILVAFIMNKPFPLRTGIRTMIYMPYVSNIVAVSIVFSVLLNPFDGPLTKLFQGLGVENVPMWLADSNYALPIVALIAVWHSLAFPVIVYLAALQEIPKTLYEAAEIDGANGFDKLKNITLPMISPTTFFLIITSLINSFKNYALVKTLTDGGPGNATRVIALNMYEEAFAFNKYSYASAQAIFLFLIIFILTMIQWKGQKKWVHYQ